MSDSRAKIKIFHIEMTLRREPLKLELAFPAGAKLPARIGFHSEDLVLTAPHTVVFCSLSDCIYYTPDPSSSTRCLCIHPDKPNYMKNATCPLYRMDWKKKAASSAKSDPRRLKPR